MALKIPELRLLSVKKCTCMSRHGVLFALLSFAHLSHSFRTDVASHCWHSHIWHSHIWHSHIWHSHSCLIRTVDPFALLAFALLTSHWCRSHFCLSHSCRTSGLCEYVIVHTILGGSPVILWISLGGKPKWLPLKFGYHDVMRTSPITFFG